MTGCAFVHGRAALGWEPLFLEDALAECAGNILSAGSWPLPMHPYTIMCKTAFCYVIPHTGFNPPIVFATNVRQMLFRPAALDRHKTCPCLHCKLAHHKLKTLLQQPCLLQLFSALYCVITHAVIAAVVIITGMIGTSDQAGL